MCMSLEALSILFYIESDRSPGHPFDVTWRRVDREKCADHRLQILGLNMKTADIKQYHRFALLNTEGTFPIIVGDIPPQDPPAPGPSLDKDQKISIQQNVSKWASYNGKNLDQVKKVLFEKQRLEFISNKDGSSISIHFTRAVTSKFGPDDELDLISDDNDPVHATFTVIAAPAQKAGK
jgi:hypothetical protein